ncbi:MAG TPA: hypothetical protein VG014_10850 [Acidimicrobiales bacterium]|nr:hypothetical protein [Acidimicrobiales bacterium]
MGFGPWRRSHRRRRLRDGRDLAGQPPIDRFANRTVHLAEAHVGSLGPRDHQPPPNLERPAGHRASPAGAGFHFLEPIGGTRAIKPLRFRPTHHQPAPASTNHRRTSAPEPTHHQRASADKSAHDQSASPSDHDPNHCSQRQ